MPSDIADRMAACNRENLKRKWATERNDLRRECHVELKQKLPIIAWAQSIVLNEDRKALLALQDETLMQLMQKLDTIAHSGKQLSHVFHNSLAAALIHRFASVLLNGNNQSGRGLATEGDDNVDYPYVLGREPATPSAQGSGRNTQTAGNCTDITAHYLPSPYTATATTDDPTQLDVRRGESPNSADRLRARLCDGNTSSSHYWETQLAELVQERTDLDRQLSEERKFLAKRCAYLRECRVAAEKEKIFAQNELASAMLLLAAAEKERAIAADFRTAATEEIMKRTPAQKRSQTQKNCCAGVGLEALGASGKKYEHVSSTAWAHSLQLHLGISPIFSQPLSTCPVKAALTSPPCESVPDGHSGHPSSNPTAMTTDNGICSMSEPECHLEAAVDLNRNDGRHSGVTSDSRVKVEVATASGILENPIGPYIRPPMPLEDMLKCIRCLFGKDKSLKTGNRARAFLGVSWSEIVSFDPDVLLRRGVLGIKEGSTGMASRLRMMTIIESALSNQNDDTIPAEVWERPTHFCDNCQKRYPISVSSNHAVLPFEESAQREMAMSPFQIPANGSNPRTQEATVVAHPRGKRNKKKLRGMRPPTHLSR